MKVLFVSAWFPCPPDNGSRIRAYSLIKALARKHDVFLISLLQEDSKRENAAQLDGICEVLSLHDSRWFDQDTLKSVLGFFSSRPRSFVDTYDPTALRAVEDAIARLSPDAVVASTLGVAEYIPRGLRIPSVLDEHNCEYAVLKRAARAVHSPLKRMRRNMGWRKFARWEAEVCRRFSAVVMVSEQDRRQILETAPGLPNVAVIQNGVDTARYDPDLRRPEPGRLIYNGALTYGANLDAVRFFASKVYPILANNLPRTKLTVTGRSDGVDLTGIADCPGIRLAGYVDDIRTELAASAACVVPLREGGGSRLKILEAMAAGLPVVATSMGAEGIDAVPEEHLLVADTAPDFADAVRRVLTDPNLAARLSRQARGMVEERYDWSGIGARFVEIVEAAVDRPSLTIGKQVRLLE